MQGPSQALTEDIHRWAEEELNRRFPGYSRLRKDIREDETTMEILRKCFNGEIRSKTSVLEIYDDLDVGRNEQKEYPLIKAGALEKITTRSGQTQLIPNGRMVDWLGRSFDLHQRDDSSDHGFPIVPPKEDLRWTIAYLSATYRMHEDSDSDFEYVLTDDNLLLEARLFAQIASRAEVGVADIRPTIEVTKFGRTTDSEVDERKKGKGDIIQVFECDPSDDPRVTRGYEWEFCEEFIIHVELEYDDWDVAVAENVVRDVLDLYQNEIVEDNRKVLPKEVPSPPPPPSSHVQDEKETLPRVLSAISSESTLEVDDGPSKTDNTQVVRGVWLYQDKITEGDDDE